MSRLDALAQIELAALNDALRQLDALHNVTARCRGLVTANQPPNGRNLTNRATAAAHAIELWAAARAAVEREEQAERPRRGDNRYRATR